MQEKLRPAFYAQTMERIESIRMGLWFMFIQRFQGHMAHAILEQGFRVIQFLNRLTIDLDHFNEAEYRIWVAIRDDFRKPLEESHRFLLSVKANARMIQKIWALNVELLGLAPMGGRRQFPASVTQQPPGGQSEQENQPCTSVPSQDVKEKSTTDNSYAGSIGTNSPNETSTDSTDCDTCSDGGASSQTNTSRQPKKSLPGTGYERGKGHPKRGNPYTGKNNTPR